VFPSARNILQQPTLSLLLISSASRPCRFTPLYPLDRKLGGPENRSGRYEDVKKFLTLPGPELRPLGHPGNISVESFQNSYTSEVRWAPCSSSVSEERFHHTREKREGTGNCWVSFQGICFNSLLHQGGSVGFLGLEQGWTKERPTLCAKYKQFPSVKAGGIYSNQCAMKD
jgi:hypothetical protein